MHNNSFDEQLVKKWQEEIVMGSHDAFRKLFDQFAEKLSHFAFSITKDREAAIGIMDEVFVRIWKNRHTLSAVENLTTYLYTSIKNSSLNHLSRKAHEQLTNPFDFVNYYTPHFSDRRNK
jgi:RNA polymerase sigma factor (sigma-70 family)